MSVLKNKRKASNRGQAFLEIEINEEEVVKGSPVDSFFKECPVLLR
jgi:hypothetical protein